MSSKSRSLLAVHWVNVAFLCGVVTTTASLVARAADVKVKRTITASETYTDNVTLASPGNEQSDFITEILPGLNVVATGARVRAIVNASLQGLLYANDSARDHLYGQLGASGNGEVVRDHLFLDGSTAYSQQVINPAQSSSTSNLFATGNQTNVWSSSISPYWKQDLGIAGRATVRYRYGYIHNFNSSLADTRSNTASADLTSDGGIPRWSWNAHVRTNRDRATTGARTRFDSAGGQVGYDITSRLTWLVNGGSERTYQYDTFGNESSDGGAYWKTGFRWSTESDRFQFLAGHRYFGRTFEGSWTHVAARFRTNVSYTETPTVVSQLELSTLPSAVSTPTTLPLPNAALPNLGLFASYVSKRLAGSFAYDMARSHLNLMVSDERRDYQFGFGSERVTDASLTWSWQVGARTSLVPSYYWQRYRQRTGTLDYITREKIDVAYTLDPTATATFSVWHEQRNSQSSLADYRVNAIMASVTKTF